jgi:hypothetical protein
MRLKNLIKNIIPSSGWYPALLFLFQILHYFSLFSLKECQYSRQLCPLLFVFIHFYVQMQFIQIKKMEYIYTFHLLCNMYIVISFVLLPAYTRAGQILNSDPLLQKTRLPLLLSSIVLWVVILGSAATKFV